MEKIRLLNGNWESFITAENPSWKFYYCRTFEEAEILKLTLSDLGNYCEIGDNSRGWFVRVKK